jgi:hypothetical protein
VKVSGKEPVHIVCPGGPMCARLEKTTAADFAPVPGNVACSQIYGGDATARVEGTLHGKPLAADFSLVNGCEISRWNEFAWLLGKAPGA